MNNIILFFLMFCGGLAVALQPSINSRLAQKIGFIESSCISFAVGTLALYFVALVAGRGNFRNLPEAAWWELSGGLLGAYFVSMTILAVPRIGTTAALAATITAQLLTGLFLDTFGFFGFRQIPFDLKRAVGVALLIAGTSLVFRR
ncbi:DMT family transporter [Geotalea sp. SG265]|uniref:DMT family transporter n=1 Tax=Geotalea sp. SG265 TaxID=2922867 RepID=UPI001FAFADA0|nr:DMT family transporter [Geotalea sp. SG265]